MFDNFDTQITCEEYYNEYKYPYFSLENDSASSVGLEPDENYIIENDVFDDIPF